MLGTELHHTEALEVELLLAGIARRYGYDMRGYSRSSLMRWYASRVADFSLMDGRCASSAMSFCIAGGNENTAPFLRSR